MSPKSPVREKRTLLFPRNLKPKDWLRFIQLSQFEKAWHAWELEDEDLRALEMLVLVNPAGNPVIPGTGGVRKLRFSGSSWAHGKSKGARIYYIYVPEKGVVFWLFAHMRDEEDYLTAAGKSAIKKLVAEIVDLLENGC